MRKLSIALGLVVAMFVAVAVRAAEDKEKTLKGTMVCGKCTLSVCKECTNVLQVKEGDKTVDYFIDDKGKAEKYHKKICPAESKQEAEVTGIISEKDGKKWIKPSKDGVKIK